MRGVRFRASGNEPGWYVEVYPDRTEIVADYGEVRLDIPASVDDTQLHSEGGAVFSADGHRVMLRAVREACVDRMAGHAYPETVRLTIGERSYSGCGLSYRAPMMASDLSWMSGCWARVGREPGNIERWSAPAAGSLIAASRSVRQGSTRGWEAMLIRETELGLEFRAAPNGQGLTVFPAVSMTEDSITFHDDGHDFPDTVHYESLGTDALAAWVEGGPEGERHRIDLRFEREGCP